MLSKAQADWNNPVLQSIKIINHLQVSVPGWYIIRSATNNMLKLTYTHGYAAACESLYLRPRVVEIWLRQFKLLSTRVASEAKIDFMGKN